MSDDYLKRFGRLNGLYNDQAFDHVQRVVRAMGAQENSIRELVRAQGTYWQDYRQPIEQLQRSISARMADMAKLSHFDIHDSVSQRMSQLRMLDSTHDFASTVKSAQDHVRKILESTRPSFDYDQYLAAEFRSLNNLARESQAILLRQLGTHLRDCPIF